MSNPGVERQNGSAPAWEDQEARQRALFREVNERIAGLGLTFQDRLQLVCECADAGCTHPVELALTEYEAARAHARRFVIAKDHENPSLEIVVAEGIRFAIVETLVGDASRIAEETNPRAATPGEHAELAQWPSDMQSLTRPRLH